MDEAGPLGLRAPAFVLPFGIELPALVPDARARLRHQIGARPDEPVILFLSRIHPKKGLHHLVEALESQAARRFSLVVAGSGPSDYEADVKTQVARGPLANRIHFTGFAQGETKQMLLQGAGFFALTSHSESFAIAAMEAMAAGTPVLITPGVPLAPFVAKFDTGWVSELDRESIARAAANALDSLEKTGEATARSDRCRALARNFEWSRIAARTKGVYEAVLSGRTPPSFDESRISLD
jgi:glycosyltransferase involved in cell wall biosynthesis